MIPESTEHQGISGRTKNEDLILVQLKYLSEKLNDFSDRLDKLEVTVEDISSTVAIWAQERRWFTRVLTGLWGSALYFVAKWLDTAIVIGN